MPAKACTIETAALFLEGAGEEKQADSSDGFTPGLPSNT